ncbi:hypothetical protein HDU97_004672 [Phlyctochytrium planicorne]|nr:hypothetical protein HDU97_004672 [Phlyctochytrium planicorne]
MQLSSSPLAQTIVSLLLTVMHHSILMGSRFVKKTSKDAMEIRRALDMMLMMQGQAISKVCYLFGYANQVLQIVLELLVPRISPTLSMVEALWKNHKKKHKSIKPKISPETVTTDSNTEGPTISDTEKHVPAELPKTVDINDTPSPNSTESLLALKSTLHGHSHITIKDNPSTLVPTRPISVSFSSMDMTALPAPSLNFTTTKKPIYRAFTQTAYRDPTSDSPTLPSTKSPSSHVSKYFIRNEFIFISYTSTLSAAGFVLIISDDYMNPMEGGTDWNKTMARMGTFLGIQVLLESAAMVAEFIIAKIPYGHFQRMSWMIAPSFMLAVTVNGMLLWSGILYLVGYGP